MKQHLERYGIYYLIGVVFLIGLLVCLAIYRPAVGTEISNQNADWGDFGAFFWGFGTMCFSLLNAVIFYHIEQRVYRKQIFDTYRDTFHSLLNAYISQNENSNDNDEVEFNAELSKGLICMIGILGGISESHSYKKEVEMHSAILMNYASVIAEQGATKGRFREYVSELSGFQICLLNNHISSTHYDETCMRAHVKIRSI